MFEKRNGNAKMTMKTTTKMTTPLDATDPNSSPAFSRDAKNHTLFMRTWTWPVENLKII